MGLFSSVLSGVTGVLGNVLQASSSAKAVKSANAATQAALQAAQAQQQQTQANYQPFLSAGTGAEEQMLRLLGLGDSNTGVSVNGNPAYSAAEQQAGAISNLQQSPLYTSQYTAGLDAINQSAAATGGLRGGNQALAQSNFGSSLLSQVIQQQLANLGTVSNQGLAAAGGIAGSNNNISNLLTQSGQANAGSILGQQGIYNNLSNNIQSSIASAAGGGSGGGLSSLLAQLTGGSASSSGGGIGGMLSSFGSGSGGITF